MKKETFPGYQLITFDDGTYGYVMADGKSKNGYKSKQGAKSAAKKLATALQVTPYTLTDIEQELADELSALYDDAAKYLVDKAKKFVSKHHTGKQYDTEALNALIKQLTAQIAKTNADAVAAINGYAPLVAAEQANFTEYAIEDGTTLNPSFTLLNQDTVLRLIKDSPAVLPKAKAKIAKNKQWNTPKLRSALTHAIVQGDSIPKLSKKVEEICGSNKAIATRNARTMMTGARNAGTLAAYVRAEKNGMHIQKQWMAALDERTRVSHRHLDGEIKPVNEKFSNGLMHPGDATGRPAEVYNCFVGDTVVCPIGDVEASFKRLYNGPIIDIKTASGVSVSVTPNHPILTPDGWVSAGSIKRGDQIFVAGRSDNIMPGVNPNPDHVAPSLAALHELFAVTSGQRTCGLSVDFHGDVSDHNVEVVRGKFSLGISNKTCTLDCGDKIAFEFPYTPISVSCAFCEFGRAAPLSTTCCVCGFDERKPIVEGGLGHALIHSLGTVSRSDTSGLKSRYDSVATDVVMLSDVFDRLALIVSADNVISINVRPAICHVYNLQTQSGVYLAASNNGNMIISHNCRCTMVPIVNDQLYEGERASKLKDMSYEEWRNAQPKPKGKAKNKKKTEGKQSSNKSKTAAMPKNKGRSNQCA